MRSTQAIWSQLTQRPSTWLSISIALTVPVCFSIASVQSRIFKKARCPLSVNTISLCFSYEYVNDRRLKFGGLPLLGA